MTQTTMAQRRRERAQRETRQLLHEFDLFPQVRIDSVIQCGLGDWAEGPVLLEKFPPYRTKYFAVDPIQRFCFEAWKAGFVGPIIQGALWHTTGQNVSLQDFRSRTSMLDQELRRGAVETRTYTLDDACQFVNYRPRNGLLWMDCEGVELEILKGAHMTLRAVNAIICELKDQPKMPNWPVADVVIQTVESYGYKFIRRVSDDGLFLNKNYFGL